MAWSHDNSSGGERRENLIYAQILPGFTNFALLFLVAAPKPALSATPLRPSCCGGGTSADAPASSVIAARIRMLHSRERRITAVRLVELAAGRLALVCHYSSPVVKNTINLIYKQSFKNPQQQAPAP